VRAFNEALELIQKDFDINVEAIEALARMYEYGYDDGYEYGYEMGQENEWFNHYCDHTYCSQDNY